ncbi:leucine-rich repeat-containing protein 74B-like [Liolophura sinensis]|uniref:leucine-rich repeat-containing protein 74B-like n=1 Tax=Liolophura sinensis TaxID=3198878 RepID=UPI00315924A2
MRVPEKPKTLREHDVEEIVSDIQLLSLVHDREKETKTASPSSCPASKNFNNLQTDGLGREFTFTGYDIMADVPPGSVFKTKLQKETEKAAELYVATCRHLGITPASYFAQRLLKSEITMKSHGLGPTGARAIAVALVDNINVQKLDLEDNGIGPDGVKCVAEMLSDNNTITDLGVAGNQIGSHGMCAIKEVVCQHQFITRLDISGNELNDHSARQIQDILETNTCLTELKASHNKFGEEGGIYLGKALIKNNTLATLDISWNHLRGKGAVAIASCLQKNEGLRVLNVAWNGFGTDGCISLQKSLRINDTLRELDISSNRIDMNGIGPLVNGVQHNGGLRVLRLGQNPVTPDVCVVILRALEKSKKTVLETLDLMDILVDKEFEEVLKTVQEKMPLKVITGAAIRNSDIVYRDGKGISGMDPIKLLFEYMNREGLRIIDLFTSLDRDGSRSVNHKEFREGLLSVNVPLTEDQIERLIDRLDKDKDGEVDFSELIEGERAYKRKQLRLKMKKEEIAKQKRIQRKKEREAEKKVNEEGVEL